MTRVDRNNQLTLITDNYLPASDQYFAFPKLAESRGKRDVGTISHKETAHVKVSRDRQEKFSFNCHSLTRDSIDELRPDDVKVVGHAAVVEH